MIVSVGVGGAAVGVALGLWLRRRAYRPGDARGPVLGWPVVVVAAVGLSAAWMVLAAASDRLEVFLVGAVFAVGGLVGIWTDLDCHRLPDWLTLPLAGMLLLLIAAGCAVTGSFQPLLDAVAAGAVLWVVFLLAAVVSSLGFGDVKLAASIGLVLGSRGWHAVLTGMVLCCVIALAWAVVALARGRDRRDRVPLGPSLIVGTFLTFVVSSAVD